MANEFIARKGLISSGSIRVSGSVTASYFVGDGSQLTNIASSTVLSSSLNIDTYTFVGNGVITNYVLSQSYDVSSLLVSVDGLSQTNILDYTLSTNTVSFVTAPPSESNILIKAFVNVAQGATGSFSGSFFGIISNTTSASYALTASYAANAGSGLSGGTQNYIPLWTSATVLTSSILYQTASGVLINSSSQRTPSAPDALGVFSISGSTSYNLISAYGNVDSYSQINIKNSNAGVSASSDIVATADNGTETSGYIDMGINSSVYALAGGLGVANDAYLYAQGANNLLIGNTAPDKKVIIFTGGGDAVANARVFIDPSGSVGINSSQFNTTNPEALLIQSINDQTYNLVRGTAGVDNYIQFNIQNISTGVSASSDIVATADNGNESINYIDMGINGGSYSNTNLVGGANDAYLYSTGNHLNIGNSTAAKEVRIFVGSTIVDTSKKLTLRDTNQHEMTGSLSVLGNISGGLVLPIGLISSSAQYPGWVTASSQIDYNFITNKLSGVVSSSAQVQPLLPNGTVSSSAQYTGWVTSSTQIDYNSIQNKLSGVVSSSAQVQPLLPGGTISSSAQYPGWITSSTQVDYNLITNKLSGVVSSSAQVQPLLPGGTISSSAQYPGWITSSTQVDYNNIQNKLSGVISSSAQFNVLTNTSSSFATTASAATSITFTPVTSSFATTASYASSGSWLRNKSGVVTSGTFTGNPRKATVTFTTAFPNTSYAVVVTGEDSRAWSIESKLAGSFVINANSNTALVGNTYWIATAYGET